jgi:sulfur carrier protein ThiS adenylyltransferase
MSTGGPVMNAFTRGLERYLSRERLAHIRSRHIGVAGAGGLGSNCALMLVRCGFRQFTIADFDTVAASNLNRQFYNLDQVAVLKVEALKQNLKAINPDVNITAVNRNIDRGNIRRIFDPCDIIVEAFDAVSAKKMVAETYADSDKLLVCASGIAGWGRSDAITVHRVHDRFFIVGDQATAVSAARPPLAPRVTLAAAKQADIVLEYVLGTPDEPKTDTAKEVSGA